MYHFFILLKAREHFLVTIYLFTTYIHASIYLPYKSTHYTVKKGRVAFFTHFFITRCDADDIMQPIRPT